MGTCASGEQSQDESRASPLLFSRVLAFAPLSWTRNSSIFIGPSRFLSEAYGLAATQIDLTDSAALQTRTSHGTGQSPGYVSGSAASAATQCHGAAGS